MPPSVVDVPQPSDGVGGRRPVVGVLGPVVGWDDTGEVSVGAPRERAVLASLAWHANRLVPVAGLIRLVWGGQAPAGARGSVHAYVSRLRHRIGALPGVELRSRTGGYLLVAGPDAVDLDAFRRLVAAARDEPDDVVAERRLRSALQLWRGAAFADLAGSPLAVEAGPVLEEERLQASEDWVERLLALGREGEAVPALRGLLRECPYRDRVCRLLMLALYRAGRRGEALAVYREASTRGVRELGLDPTPALRGLHEAILRDDPVLAATPTTGVLPVAAGGRPGAVRAPGAGGAAADAARPVFVGREADRPVFVGRSAELGVLAECLSDAVAGRGRVVLLAGEPGMGKTRLAEEVAARAAGLGAEVVWGGCYEGAGAPAFWPWISAIRLLLDGVSPDAARAALGAGAADVAQIVAEVKELVPGLEPLPALDPEAARFRLYDAVTRFALRLAARRPLVLVIDDLHWADAASLQLLGMLAGQLRQARVLVLATYRDGEVGAEHPLVETLAVLSRQPMVRRVVLAGLDAAEVGEFIAAATGGQPSGSLVEVVHGRTDGNPFFVAELVRLLDRDGGLSGEGAQARLGAAVPAGVRDVIRQRLALLEPGTAELLGVAAAAGQEFDLDVLARAVGSDEERVLVLVESAMAGRLVVESPAVVGRWRFAHALIREALYEQLSAARRARAHRRVGEALEDLHDGAEERVAELAHHWRQAAPTGRGAADKAVGYALRAAELAVAGLAYEQAEDQLRWAVELAAGLPAGRARAERELPAQMALIRLLIWTRSYAAPEVGQACSRAAELCRQLGEHDEVVSLWSLWAYYNVRPDYHTSQELAARLLEAGRSRDPAFLMAGHLAAGCTAVQMGRILPAEEHLQRCAAIADGMDDQQLVRTFAQHPGISSRAWLAMVGWLVGEHDQATARMDDALARARRLDHPFTLCFVLTIDGWLATYRQDPAHARRRADELITLSTARGFPLYTALAGIVGGWASAEQGDTAAGVTDLRGGIDALHATGAGMLRHFHLGLLAQAHRRANHLDDALTAIEQALTRAADDDEHFYEPELHRIKGEILHQLTPDRPAEARASLNRAIAIAHAQHATSFEQRARHSLDRLVAAAGG